LRGFISLQRACLTVLIAPALPAALLAALLPLLPLLAGLLPATLLLLAGLRVALLLLTGLRIALLLLVAIGILVLVRILLAHDRSLDDPPLRGR
jgi:hypothetical protein